MKKHPTEIFELSRPLQIDKIPLGGVEEHIVASPLERTALKQRFDLEDILELEAFLNVDRAQGNMLVVTGRIRAKVVQSCVVTLEPIHNLIEEPVDILFAPDPPRQADAATIGWNDLDPPEPIHGGVIDLGELVAQHLGTAIDPYPRKEGAVFKDLDQDDHTPLTPFSGLKEALENKDKTKK